MDPLLELTPLEKKRKETFLKLMAVGKHSGRITKDSLGDFLENFIIQFGTYPLNHAYWGRSVAEDIVNQRKKDADGTKTIKELCVLWGVSDTTVSLFIKDYNLKYKPSRKIKRFDGRMIS